MPDPVVLSLSLPVLRKQLLENEQEPRELIVPPTAEYRTGQVLRYNVYYQQTDDPLSYRMVGARQGRNTSATYKAAATKLQQFCDHNSAERLQQFFGGASRLYVGFCICYEGHHDPGPHAPGSSLALPANIQCRKSLAMLIDSLEACQKATDSWLNGRYADPRIRQSLRLLR